MSQKLRKALKIYSKTYYDVHKIINKRETFAKLKILNEKKMGKRTLFVAIFY